MTFVRKALLVLAAAVLCLSVANAAACKYNNGEACPQELPCCSPHGRCGNTPAACGTGCDPAASFQGACKQYVPLGRGPSSKPHPIPTLPKGSFKVVGHTGVAAQHIALVRPTKMLIIDKAEANPAKLPSGRSAYNVEYDITTNEYRVLEVATNTFCSGGGFLPNGTLISAGGAEARHASSFYTNGGFQSLRMWQPCDDQSCQWIENPEDPMWSLTGNRWYVSIATLSDGRLFILGGSNESLAINRYATNNPTWEIYPKDPKKIGFEPVFMQFMVDALPNNLYADVYPLPDGNIFIFANQKSIIFNVDKNEVVKTLPDIPGGPRSYPLTGTVVLLPLDPAKNYAHEVLVCGGTERMSTSSRALDTCGRINLSEENPQWEMDKMPTGRLMSDGVIMADGKIMILNGCQLGYAGFVRGNDPILTPLVYDPNAPLGQRFTEWTPSNIPRMYHSVAMLLPDASIWVAGSNQNSEVRMENVAFPTEYRVEIFTPPYLTTDLERPVIETQIPNIIKYAQKHEITIDVKDKSKYQPEITFWLGRRGFVTHSTHMSQRMTKLVAEKVREHGTKITYSVAMPPNGNIMPPGPHYLHVTNNGVPSIGQHTLLNA